MRKLYLAIIVTAMGFTPLSIGETEPNNFRTQAALRSDSQTTPHKQGSWYFGAFGGAMVHNDVYDTLPAGVSQHPAAWGMGGIEAGYEFNSLRLFEGLGIIPAIEYEAFYSGTYSELRAGGLSAGIEGDAANFLLSGLFKLDFTNYFRPYIGGGIGLSYVHYKSTGAQILDQDELYFTAQGLGGLEFPLTDQFRLYVEYKYLHYEGDQSIGNHGVVSGLGYKF